MAGKIMQLIDRVVEERSKGDPTIKHTTRAKLILKGININKYSEISEDDPGVIAKLIRIAAELGIKIN